MQIAAVFFLLAMLLASGGLWIWAFLRVAQRKPLVAATPREPVPWGFVDLIVAFIFWAGTQMAAGLMLRQAFGIRPSLDAGRSIQETQTILWAMACSVIASFVLSLGWVALRTRTGPRRQGFELGHFLYDLAIGLAAFVMIAPVVFVIQAILVSIWQPTQHPLILLLQDQPDLGLFLAASASAVLVAPVVEEYFFRGLLQGWMQAIRWPLDLEELLLGRRPTRSTVPETPEPLPAAEGVAPPPESTEDFAPPGDNPYAPPPIVAELAEPAHKSGDVAMPGDLASHAAAHWIATWWPTLVSSALFALAHVSHGPDFIPLFPFALALGYVYQRTGRLLPSMVMHFSLNLTSMVVLWLQLFGPKP